MDVIKKKIKIWLFMAGKSLLLESGGMSATSSFSFSQVVFKGFS